jgi:hypothetical protein
MVKVLLARALDNLETQHLIKRKRFSHKDVRYSLQNEGKATLRLKARLDDFYEIQREFEELAMLQEKTIDDLNRWCVLGFATHLRSYELLICEARANDEDTCSLDYFTKDGRDNLMALWDAFAENLRARSIPEIGEYYEKHLKKAKRLEPSINLSLEEWIENYKKNHYAELQGVGNIVELFEGCLAQLKKRFEMQSKFTDQELTENAMKTLNFVKTKMRNKLPRT